MNCPRCKAPIGPLTNPDAIVTCAGCGSRLMTRAAAARSQGSSPQAAATVPPSPAPPASPPSPPPPQAGVKVGVRPTTVSGKSTGAAARTGGRKTQPVPPAVTLETLLAEIQALHASQQLVLEALDDLRRRRAASPGDAAAADGMDDSGRATVSPIRTAARKSVVLVDDDPATRQEAASELERAEIPVRAFADANKALSAIAEAKPDMIVLELGVTGDLAGKDLVNMIRATMEWVDIPIVLWTREPVSNQKEARQIHGADEVVAKSLGAATLVARVITIFRH
jgi:CheY-like chemotaxis protein